MEGVVSVPSFDTIVVDDGGGATSVGELVVYLWSLSQDTTLHAKLTVILTNSSICGHWKILSRTISGRNQIMKKFQTKS